MYAFQAQNKNPDQSYTVYFLGHIILISNAIIETREDVRI